MRKKLYANGSLTILLLFIGINIFSQGYMNQLKIQVNGVGGLLPISLGPTVGSHTPGRNIITGAYTPQFLQSGNLQNRLFVTELNVDGTQLWTRNITPLSDTPLITLRAIIRCNTVNGSILNQGYLILYHTNINSTYICRLDNNGNILYHKQVSIAGPSSFHSFAILQRANNELVILGRRKIWSNHYTISFLTLPDETTAGSQITRDDFRIPVNANLTMPSVHSFTEANITPSGQTPLSGIRVIANIIRHNLPDSNRVGIFDFIPNINSSAQNANRWNYQSSRELNINNENTFPSDIKIENTNNPRTFISGTFKNAGSERLFVTAINNNLFDFNTAFATTPLGNTFTVNTNMFPYSFFSKNSWINLYNTLQGNTCVVGFSRFVPTNPIQAFFNSLKIDFNNNTTTSTSDQFEILQDPGSENRTYCLDLNGSEGLNVSARGHIFKMDYAANNYPSNCLAHSFPTVATINGTIALGPDLSPYPSINYNAITTSENVDTYSIILATTCTVPCSNNFNPIFNYCKTSNSNGTYTISVNAATTPNNLTEVWTVFNETQAQTEVFENGWNNNYVFNNSESYIITRITTNANCEPATTCYAESLPANPLCANKGFKSKSVKIADAYTGAEDKKSSSFVVYPNPAQNEVTISFSDKQFNNKSIRVFSLDGRLIATQNINNRITKLNAAKWIAGSYVIDVIGKNYHAAQKVTIIK